jgi:hypothetical protein
MWRWVGYLVLASCAAYGDTGNRACATCHADIFKSYQQTAMAHSSGPVTRIESKGEFEHALSGVRYRVYSESQAAFFDFDLPEVHGRRQLQYFIGSGTVGRSYLFSADGFLYQAPVAWYSATATWGLSPGYQRNSQLFLTRPVESSCLQCHASGLQPISGTRNGYASPPFREEGISCERCHGPGEDHVRTKGKIVNPAKLAADRRDSICAQCHMAGETRVPRAGQKTFHPGDRLSDAAVVFVWSDRSGDPKPTSSHFESLLQSACKRAAGDKIWCGTCHDPHRVPADAENTTYYRARCLNCHEARQCLRGNDCVSCHMPKSSIRDIEHSVYTDHAIRKLGASATTLRSAGERKLVPFDGAAVGDRELGLAYAGVGGFQGQAIQYLERAPQHDPLVLAQLALLYDRTGREEEAIPLYEEALKIDPGQVASAVNLGSILMKKGQAEEAMRLWAAALERSPGTEAARMNLAVAQYRVGNFQSAEASLRKLLELNPGATLARKILNEMVSHR